MIELDEIIYDALTADTELMQAVGQRIRSTCFEVGPDETDNTPLPCIIVTDNGSQEQPETKDCEWLPYEEKVQAGIEIDGNSPKEVRTLIRKARKAVAAYIKTLAESDTDIPYLDSIQRDGMAWDWMKPCYFDTLRYNCTLDNNQTE